MGVLEIYTFEIVTNLLVQYIFMLVSVLGSYEINQLAIKNIFVCFNDFCQHWNLI